MGSYKIDLCDSHCYFFKPPKDEFLAIDRQNMGKQIDENAVFSILQFGAIIPPLSPWKEIQRFMPGYYYSGIQKTSHINLPIVKSIYNLEPEQQVAELEKTLDKILLKLIGSQKDPVLLFSGGVDSGLIASRLVQLGYKDSLLLNYSFGEDDQESILAEAMAQHLGLKFERIFSTREICDCLRKPGKIYPQPFADHSTVPTSDLAHAVVERLAGEKRLIIDGTGADGAFGMNNKVKSWEWVMRVPALLRRIAAARYDNFFWCRPGKLEYTTRILRRSVDMPPLSAILAQNPLAGKLYKQYPSAKVYQLLDEWIAPWPGCGFLQRIIAGDLMLTCANIFAQKGLPILEAGGHGVIYPFLDIDMVASALCWGPDLKMRQSKALLKQSLEKYVPRDMVYRPKSGFVDLRQNVFFEAEFIDYLRDSVEPTSPVSFILSQKEVIKVCDLLSKRVWLPPQTLNCIWAIVFTSRWYATA